MNKKNAPTSNADESAQTQIDSTTDARPLYLPLNWTQPARPRGAARAKLPAYGRDLQHALASGKALRHGVAVFVDRPVERGSFMPLAVFSDTDPNALDWSLCRGLDVTVPHADQVKRDRLIATIRAIKAARPKRLMLLKQDPPGHEFVVSAEGAK